MTEEELSRIRKQREQSWLGYAAMSNRDYARDVGLLLVELDAATTEKWLLTKTTGLQAERIETLEEKLADVTKERDYLQVKMDSLLGSMEEDALRDREISEAGHEKEDGN